MTMPATQPYSSTTIAMCWFWRAELRQERAEVLRLGHDVGRADEILDHHLVDADVVERLEEVAHVEDPEHVVERLAIDGIPRVRRVDHRGERLLRRQVDRERHDLRPRDHHLVGLLVGEVEDLVDHLLLGRLDRARVLGRGDEVADVLLGRCGHDPRAPAVTPKQPRDRRSADLSSSQTSGYEDRPRMPRAAARARAPAASAFSSAIAFGTSSPSTTLRYVRITNEITYESQPGDAKYGSKKLRDERLADGTEQDPEDRDPDLDGADEADRAVHEPQRRRARAAAVASRPLQPRSPRRHERVLGRHEHGVPRDERSTTGCGGSRSRPVHRGVGTRR